MDKSSQIFTEGEERKTNHLGGILSPKRNLGHELSEVMKRSSF